MRAAASRAPASSTARRSSNRTGAVVVRTEGFGRAGQGGGDVGRRVVREIGERGLPHGGVARRREGAGNRAELAVGGDEGVAVDGAVDEAEQRAGPLDVLADPVNGPVLGDLVLRELAKRGGGAHDQLASRDVGGGGERHVAGEDDAAHPPAMRAPASSDKAGHIQTPLGRPQTATRDLRQERSGRA